jgi:hypothetical protein
MIDRQSPHLHVQHARCSCAETETLSTVLSDCDGWGLMGFVKSWWSGLGRSWVESEAPYFWQSPRMPLLLTSGCFGLKLLVWFSLVWFYLNKVTGCLVFCEPRLSQSPLPQLHFSVHSLCLSVSLILCFWDRVLLIVQGSLELAI